MAHGSSIGRTMHKLAAGVLLVIGLMGAGATCRAQAPKNAPANKPPPFKLNTPTANADMDAINARLAKLNQAAANCGSCVKNGGTVDCSGSLKTFDEADAYLKHLSELYNENKAAMDDLLRHIAQYKSQMDEFTARDQAVKDAYNKSKILSDSAKLTLDLISLSDTASALKDASSRLKVGWTMTDTDAVINQFVLKDSTFEAVSGTISTADDLLGARLGGTGSNNKIPQVVSNLQTIKGGFSDLSGAILAARAAYTKAQAIGDPAQKLAAMKGSAKGVLNALAKVGIYFAEKKQAELANEIADNVATGKAHDQMLSDLMAQYNQLVRRMAAIAKAREAARDALHAAISCSGKCPGAMAPSPVAPASDYGGGDLVDYGNGLKSPYTYGEAMRKTNASLAATGKSPSSLDNMCKENDKTPAPQTAAKPAAKKPCPKGGGIAGAIENVACQDSQ